MTEQHEQQRQGPARPVLWGSVIVGLCAASAVLWMFVIVAFFGIFAEFLDLQASVIERVTGDCVGSVPYDYDPLAPTSVPPAVPVVPGGV